MSELYTTTHPCGMQQKDRTVTQLVHSQGHEVMLCIVTQRAPPLPYMEATICVGYNYSLWVQSDSLIACNHISWAWIYTCTVQPLP